MAEEKSMRLSQVAKILNKGLSSVAKSLSASGFKVETNPNTKINTEQLEVLAKEYNSAELLSGTRRHEPSVAVVEPTRRREEDFLPTYRRDDAGRPLTEAKIEAPKPALVAEPVKPSPQAAQTVLPGLKVLGKIDLNAKPAPQVKAPVDPKPAEAPKPAPAPIPVAPAAVVETPVQKPVQPEPAKPPVQQIEAKVTAPAAPVEVTKPAPTVEPVARVEPPKAEPIKVEAAKPVAPAPVAEQPRVANRPPRTEKPAPKAANQTTSGTAAKPADKATPAAEETPAKPTETIRAAGSHQLGGLKILGKIELPTPNSRQGNNNNRREGGKRKRIRGVPGPASGNPQAGQPGQGNRTPANRTPANRAPGDRNQNQAGTPRDGNRPPAQGTATPNTNTANNRPAGAGANTGNANRSGNSRTGAQNRGTGRREAPTQADVNKSIQQTRDRMRGNTPNRGADRRRDRRSQREDDRRAMNEQEEMEAKILRVTEFVSANDLASLMDVSINEVISVCLSLGMFVSINQRLDAEAITVIADEFGYDVQFISAEDETEAGVDTEADNPEDLQPRAPIVTIMGHVDHGKTSLLDYIRREKVAAGEAGGITQHIGAYSVKASKDRTIAFLDTPGHEAFTAMRARGAKVTDVVIIVIAADDSVMPQTREAINHAQVAGVPIVFAFSKVDKSGADTEKIRAELSSMNMLVEEWGGKYQTQEISSKSGAGIDDLLEKVLLEAELLELTANPDRRALGTVIEASLDKGRGYVSTVLVENGTLRQGDIVLVGAHYGRIRAMTNDRGERIKEAGPSQPVQILGLPGAPQAGDKFNVMETEREAREIANKREQLLREQTLRTRKHITLEEIGRRKAIGTFKELNVIVKGDFDGSVEALSDSLLQLTTEEVQVNIIHKAVGQISESDILLASASDAVIVGFQVRPSASARKLAEQEQIEIRLYSIIYDAINEVRDAMEGLLAPSVEEIIVGTIEVRDVFKISKIGTVAGCYVTEGNIKRNNKIRVIRDFIVVHTGEISALKRFKDDVNEVKFGYECGLSIRNFNDIEVGDVIESFDFKEVKRTL
ncbi:MAG: translation initiation factor IF-2 [Spirosoma sp.]|nr:translation initiation factor IF-2 [Spirosoma sp.]